MKKSITREQIIQTALELLKDRREVGSLNLREVARTLGCAHTNLYNYFPSLQDLLWEAHMEIEARFIERISSALEQVHSGGDKLYQFYFTLSELYLSHRGWFRLAWLDHIGDARPEKDQIATAQAASAMVEMLARIWLDISPSVPTRQRIRGAAHDVHCYVVGEVSNFINGRGVIGDAELLKEHIAETAASFFTLTLREA